MLTKDISMLILPYRCKRYDTMCLTKDILHACDGDKNALLCIKFLMQLVLRLKGSGIVAVNHYLKSLDVHNFRLDGPFVQSFLLSKY